MYFENTSSFAYEADKDDALNKFRQFFLFPQHNGKDVLYFCGNSLGLQPKTVSENIKQELEDWAKFGVEGHFKARHPWYPYHEFVREPMARIVGALPEETVVMNSLTVNLHLLMVSFYRPDAKRYKIMCEAGAFPSDRYALKSQVEFHASKIGFDPKNAIIEIAPRKGEDNLRTEDIILKIFDHRDDLALAMFSGVNFYSGQYFEIKAITDAAHQAGAVAGFDLAHAAGNVPLHLHDWNVDFAVWCTYKYLNAGPGSVGASFVHSKHLKKKDLPRFAGWWGNDPATRFSLPELFVPVERADAWQLSNAPVFSMASLRASLELFDAAGIINLVDKSRKLTGYLEFIINGLIEKNNCRDEIELITPHDEKHRGCQLSLVFRENGKQVYDFLASEGVIVDWREPDVIRISPVPLYNSFEDVFRFGGIFEKAIQKFCVKEMS